ncbi:hypothetical protein FNF27_03798 [Cafeteria roenbergensis]|uniref:Uncharacterized protein n=1 Tax=Cafeteria roenbergensis TaxID=33653 RepID=A0A5A8D342_CAFRO|nr:hypothetical protein FNF29_03734 [Cafeteria roenbergensis]KAA0158680.1 hypothetical protein FNF28_06115 [Cafeteria roenbergensis]KAA0174675.1 hypothetical protein FNF27_03798 [Cafeteria roenbergensis]|eukprot:KAA0152507.1 hypothetical protein FNF29_03734 [Cafeteria roenbergensis]
MRTGSFAFVGNIAMGFTVTFTLLTLAGLGLPAVRRVVEGEEAVRKDMFEQSLTAVVDWQKSSPRFVAREDPAGRWAESHKQLGNIEADRS